MSTTCPPQFSTNCTSTPEVCQRACQRYNLDNEISGCSNINLDAFSCDDNNECTAKGVDANGNEIKIPFDFERIEKLGCQMPPNCANCPKNVGGKIDGSNIITQSPFNNLSGIYRLNNNNEYGLNLDFSGNLTPERIDEKIQLIKNYIESVNGEVLEINKYYRDTINEPITTSLPDTNVGQSTAAPVVGRDNNMEFINKSLDQLTVNDVKILLSALMSVDLDNVGDSSIFSLLSSARDRLMRTNEYDSDRSLGEELNNYRTTEMPQKVKDYLRRYDPTTYNIFFGKNRSHKHNALHIPGFQYTPPSSWPSQQYKPPVCTIDENKKNEPVPFYAKGAPVDALEYDKLKILPMPEYRFV